METNFFGERKKEREKRGQEANTISNRNKGHLQSILSK